MTGHSSGARRDSGSFQAAASAQLTATAVCAGSWHRPGPKDELSGVAQQRRGEVGLVDDGIDECRRRHFGGIGGGG